MFRKNDSLVDSVKAVMEQNDALRRVEAQVNEQFGISSKNALPHERHAEYDAVLAEAKKCMYEEDKVKAPDTPEHHRAEAIRLHKAIKAGNRTPLNYSKRKQHEEAYKKATGKELHYPESLDETVDQIEEGEVVDFKAAKEDKLNNDKQRFLNALTGKKDPVPPKDRPDHPSKWVSRRDKDKKKLDEAEYSPKQKLLAKLGNKSGHGGDPEKIDKPDLEAARKGHAHKVGLEESDKKAKVKKVMDEWKAGKLNIGKSDKTVPETKKGQKQAVAIALNSAEKMNEGIEAIKEEIRTNLEEKLVAVYESGDEAALESFVNSLTEEQIAILGLNEGLWDDAKDFLSGKTAANQAKQASNMTNAPGYGITKTVKGEPTPGMSDTPQRSSLQNPTPRVSSGKVAGDTGATNRVAKWNPDAPTTTSSSAMSGGQAGTAPEGGYIPANAGRQSGVRQGDGYNPRPMKNAPQVTTTDSGAKLTQSPSVAKMGPTAAEKRVKSAQASTTVSTSTSQATKSVARPTTTNNPVGQRPAIANRPGQAAPARRVPGAAAAAAQKRIGYTTASAKATPGDLMRLGEETKPEIKESFEQFLRTRFLKD